MHALRWALPALVGAAAFACFAPALEAGWVNFDDGFFILDNPHFMDSPGAYVAWAFRDIRGVYIPLTWLSLGLDHAIYGFDQPWGWHLTNLLLHAATSVLAYFVILAFLGKHSSQAMWAACAGALFFAIHPQRVESVAWITERRDVLSGLFLMLTVLSYLRAVRRPPSRTWLAASVACYALSLGAKANAMLLPLLLLVIDVYPLRRTGDGWKRLILEKLPHVAFAGAAAVLAWAAQEHIGALRNAPLALRAMQPGYRVSFYLWKSLVPLDLSPLYLFRADADPWQLKFVAGTLLAVGLTVALVALRKRWPAGLVTWICVGAFLAPTLGLPQVGPHSTADRYMYLASLPLAVLGAAGLLRLRDAKVEWAWPLGGSVACGLVVAWAVLSMEQSVIWRDSIALWTRAIELDPRHQIAYYNRGLAHFEAGRAKLAIADYTVAIELAPSWPWPYGNRGVARMETDPERALEDFTRVIELEPEGPMTYANRAVAREVLGDVEGAIADRERALELAAPDWSKRAEVRKALETLRQRSPR